MIFTLDSTTLWWTGVIAFALYGLLMLAFQVRNFNSSLVLTWVVGQAAKTAGCLSMAVQQDERAWVFAAALLLGGLALDFLAAALLLRGEWRIRTTLFLLTLVLAGLASAAVQPPPVARQILLITIPGGLFIFSFLIALAASASQLKRSISRIIFALAHYGVALIAFAVLLGQVLPELSVAGAYAYADLVVVALPLLLVLSVIQASSFCLMARERARLERERRRRLDPHTGALNPYGFSIETKKIRAICSRLDQSTSLVVLEVDGFDKVAEMLDRTTRKKLFRDLVAALQYCLRKHDKVARLQQNCFAVLLPFTDVSRARLACDRLRNQIDRDVIVLHEGREYAISVSFGITDVPDREIELDDAIDRAQTALSRSEKRGCEIQQSGDVLLLVQRQDDNLLPVS